MTWHELDWHGYEMTWNRWHDMTGHEVNEWTAWMTDWLKRNEMNDMKWKRITWSWTWNCFLSWNLLRYWSRIWNWIWNWKWNWNWNTVKRRGSHMNCHEWHERTWTHLRWHRITWSYWPDAKCDSNKNMWYEIWSMKYGVWIYRQYEVSELRYQVQKMTCEIYRWFDNIWHVMSSMNEMNEMMNE